MKPTLTEDDFQNAAKLLKCELAAIKAVAEVESSGNGFLTNGEIKILFEGHIFYRFTKGKYAASHPKICYPKWTTQFYAKGPNADARGMGELARLKEAMELDHTAALLSASYGKFQIMGFNHAICGYKTVDEFYEAMQVSEGNHLDAFCNYIIHNSLDDELRLKRWADFAKKYNGPLYSKNRYDVKLAVAYAKYANS